MNARPRIFVLKRVPPRPFDRDELCDCCGMGAVAANVQFDWPPEAHFDACWLCAELLTIQAMLGAGLVAILGKGRPS